ncbi:MAG: LacI family DNA-binding transcriptional regulator [Actinomycetota bacterium]
MPKRDATLHDVAKLVGVSPRTVSRVVNNEGGFSAKTETRVRTAIAELGYRPNLLARGLIRGRSSTIALVGPTMTDPFFPELAEGVQRAASDHDLTLFMASTADDGAEQGRMLETLASYVIEGAIVFPVDDTDEQLEALARSGLHLVTIDRAHGVPGAPNIKSDIEAGARRATQHLLDRGCEHIAFLDGSQTLTGRRRAGYDAVTGGDGVTTARVDNTAEGGMRAMSRILDMAPSIDGVFAYNDMMAIGALRVLAERGLRVPDDVAVVGFDDISVSSMLYPALTTVRLDQARIGREAVDQIVALTNGEPVAPETLIPVELVVRESA